MMHRSYRDEAFADLAYEAAVVPEFWPSVLRRFAEIAESDEGVIITKTGPALSWVASSSRFDAIAQAHYQHQGGVERTRRLVAFERAGFVTDSDVFSQEEIAAEPLFNDLLIPAGLGRGIATVLRPNGDDLIVVHAEGPVSAGPVSKALMQKLDALRPDFARAAFIASRLGFERVRTAVETLEALGTAACAVDWRGRLLVENAAFAKDSAYWTTRGQERIALADARADQQLQLALESISSATSVRSIPISATTKTGPAILHLVPVRRAANDIFTNASSLLVLAKATRSAPATALIQTLFDLTAAEAAVAGKIAAGQTVAMIAAATAKSPDTIRNQLKSVLEKTGCKRQVDLTRLLTQLG